MALVLRPVMRSIDRAVVGIPTEGWELRIRSEWAGQSTMERRCTSALSTPYPWRLAARLSTVPLCPVAPPPIRLVSGTPTARSVCPHSTVLDQGPTKPCPTCGTPWTRFPRATRSTLPGTFPLPPTALSGGNLRSGHGAVKVSRYQKDGHGTLGHQPTTPRDIRPRCECNSTPFIEPIQRAQPCSTATGAPCSTSVRRV